jgi:hypothetical protein
MRQRRTQLRRDAVPAERRHPQCREDARRHGKKYATPPGGTKRAAKDDDRQHGAKRELQPDRLVHQSQRRDGQPVRRAPRQCDGSGACEPHRHREDRERGRTEQIRPGRVGRERNAERQQRNQHRNHQPAFRAPSTEQHNARDQRQGAQIDRRRQPAQAERGREVMPRDKPHQFPCQPPTDEAEAVIDGVVRRPVHVERHDVDRDEQHDRRPHRDCDGDADVEQWARALTGCDARDRHRICLNGLW